MSSPEQRSAAPKVPPSPTAEAEAAAAVADKKLKDTLIARAEDFGLQSLLRKEKENGGDLLDTAISIMRRMSTEKLRDIGIESGDLDHISDTDRPEPRRVQKAILDEIAELRAENQARLEELSRIPLDDMTSEQMREFIYLKGGEAPLVKETGEASSPTGAPATQLEARSVPAAVEMSWVTQAISSHGGWIVPTALQTGSVPVTGQFPEVMRTIYTPLRTGVARQPSPESAAAAARLSAAVRKAGEERSRALAARAGAHRTFVEDTRKRGIREDFRRRTFFGALVAAFAVLAAVIWQEKKEGDLRDLIFGPLQTGLEHVGKFEKPAVEVEVPVGPAEVFEDPFVVTQGQGPPYLWNATYERLEKLVPDPGVREQVTNDFWQAMDALGPQRLKEFGPFTGDTNHYQPGTFTLHEAAKMFLPDIFNKYGIQPHSNA